MGTDYIAKGFNFFKQPPVSLALTEAGQGGERGEGLFQRVLTSSQSLPKLANPPKVPSFLVQLLKNNHNHFKCLQNVTFVPSLPISQVNSVGFGEGERAKRTNSQSSSLLSPGRQGACNYTHALHDAPPTRMSRPSSAPGTHGNGAGGGAIGEE